MMILSYRDVEELFAARFGILSDRRLAFRGRLDRLRQLGCPQGVNTGKGRPASFGWTQILELAFALDLVNLGFTPENTAGLLKENLALVQIAITQLIDLESNDAVIRAATGEKWPAHRTMFLAVEVGALSGLMADGSTKSSRLQIIDGQDISEWFAEATVYDTPIGLLDLGTRLGSLLLQTSIWSGQSIASVAADFRAWTNAASDKTLNGLGQ